MKIEQRQIWEVTKDGFLAKKYSGDCRDRKVLIGIGEKIEIRFPFAWHFRTEVDNNYFQATEEEIQKHCKFFGRIWEEVAWKNIADLKDILRLKLYHDPKEWARKQEKK